MKSKLIALGKLHYEAKWLRDILAYFPISMYIPFVLLYVVIVKLCLLNWRVKFIIGKTYAYVLHVVATLGDVEIELDPSSMFRILGVHDEGVEVIDSNSWPIVENFNP